MSAAAPPAASIAATTFRAAALAAASVPEAVVPCVRTPKRKPARSGTVVTNAVPVTVMPRSIGWAVTPPALGAASRAVATTTAASLVRPITVNVRRRPDGGHRPGLRSGGAERAEIRLPALRDLWRRELDEEDRRRRARGRGQVHLGLRQQAVPFPVVAGRARRHHVLPNG